MKYQDEVISYLKVLTTNVIYFVGGLWYFEYDGCQMVYIPEENSSNTIRICIPHFNSVDSFDYKRLTTAINETNREIKYVKIVVLGNGSISINYDHKYNGENDLYSMLLHMIKTLCFATEYLKSKLSEK